MKSSSFLLSGLFLAALTVSAKSQIVFQTPVAINTSDPSQIYSLGTYVDAVGVNGYTSDTVQIGATSLFHPLFSDTGITFSSPTNIGTGSDGTGTTATPYQEILDGVAYVGDFNAAHLQTGTVSLKNLKLGHVYEAQVFSFGNFNTEINGVTSKNLFRDYSIGVFVADSPIQTFTFDSSLSGIGEINAISLRDISSIVPEPSTWALMLAGLAVLGLSLRRSKARI